MSVDVAVVVPAAGVDLVVRSRTVVRSLTVEREVVVGLVVVVLCLGVGQQFVQELLSVVEQVVVLPTVSRMDVVPNTDLIL